jgi:transposase
MHKVNLGKRELAEIIKLKKETNKKRLFRRLQCIELAGKKKEYREIASITGVCVDTITDWVKIYNKQGLDGLCQLNFEGKRQSKIDEYAESIKADIKSKTISTLAELQDWLETKYKIKMEKSWLFRCCKKNSICLAKKPA